MLNGLFSSLKASCRKIFNRGARSDDPAPDSFQDDPFAKFMRAVLDTPTDAFPETIELTPENEHVLSAFFGYKQDVYDLAEYEALVPGSGRKIWEMIEATRKRLEWLAERPDPNGKTRAEMIEEFQNNLNLPYPYPYPRYKLP